MVEDPIICIGIKLLIQIAIAKFLSEREKKITQGADSPCLGERRVMTKILDRKKIVSYSIPLFALR